MTENEWPKSFPLHVFFKTVKGQILDEKGTIRFEDGRQFDSITLAAVNAGADMGKSGWRCFSAYVPDSTVSPILVETLRRKKVGPWTPQNISESKGQDKRIKTLREEVWPTMLCSCAGLMGKNVNVVWDISGGLSVSFPLLTSPGHGRMEEIALRFMLMSRCTSEELQAVVKYKSASSDMSFLLMEPTPDERLNVGMNRCSGTHQARNMCHDLVENVLKKWNALSASWSIDVSERQQGERCSFTPPIMLHHPANASLQLLPGPGIEVRCVTRWNSQRMVSCVESLNRAVMRFCLNHLGIVGCVFMINNNSVCMSAWIPIKT